MQRAETGQAHGYGNTWLSHFGSVRSFIHIGRVPNPTIGMFLMMGLENQGNPAENQGGLWEKPLEAPPKP